jgi:aspartyl-tRNA(Asn)/glutamyl-tRNA(Gln) amidotransferase subunit B
MVLAEEFIEEIRSRLPELPVQRCFRLMEQYGLSPYQAEIITSSKNLADFFEETLAHYPQPQKVSNWLIGDILGLLNSTGQEIKEVTFTPLHFSALLKLLDAGTLSGRLAKEVLEASFLSGKHPEEIVKEKGLAQISDEEKLLPVIEEVIKGNPGAVSDYTGGNKKAIGFLVGQVMQRTRGQANPQLVTELLKKQLGEGIPH